MSRSRGATRLITRSPMRISPSVIDSSPASIRSAVVLPEPDGPTSTRNSPSPASSVSSRTASTLSKRLVTWSKRDRGHQPLIAPLSIPRMKWRWRKT